MAQVLAHHVPVVAVADEAAGAAVRERLDGTGTHVLTGADAAARIAAEGADVVLNGITGSVGLGPTLAALGAGSTLALANKESLVVGGPLVRAAQRRPDQAGPGRLRALGDRPGAAVRHPRRGPPAGADGIGWPLPGDHARRAQGRHRGTGAGAPDVVDGSRGDHQLRDDGEQGPRA